MTTLKDYDESHEERIEHRIPNLYLAALVGKCISICSDDKANATAIDVKGLINERTRSLRLSTSSPYRLRNTWDCTIHQRLFTIKHRL
jgi:hypothetical protein